MSSLEFSEWQAFDILEPIGGPHLDRLVQRLAFVTFNAARMGAATKVKPMKEEEFAFIWHSFDEVEEEGDEDAMTSKVMGIMGMLG